MTNKRNLYMTIGVLLLVGINIALIVILMKGKDHPGGPPGGAPFTFLEQELQMTGQQKKDYAALREANHQVLDSLRQEMIALHKALYAGKDKSATDSIITLIGNVQAKHERLTYDHFMKVRALCTAEQQKKFDSVISEVLERMAPKPPPRPEDRR